MLASAILTIIFAFLFVLTLALLTHENRRRLFSWPLFFIFVFSIWIFSAYVQPLEVGGRTNWIPVLVFSIFLFLFALALTPEESLRFPRRTSPAVPPSDLRSAVSRTQSISVISLGFFTWLLLFFLLGLVLLSYWYWWPWPY